MHYIIFIMKLNSNIRQTYSLDTLKHGWWHCFLSFLQPHSPFTFILWKRLARTYFKNSPFSFRDCGWVNNNRIIFFVWIIQFYKDITLLFTEIQEDEWICIAKMANVFYNYPKKAWKASEGLLKRSKTIVISIYIL